MNTQEKTYSTAFELAETLGISMGQAYKIIRQLNSELAKDGYITVEAFICTLKVYLDIELLKQNVERIYMMLKIFILNLQ